MTTQNDRDARAKVWELIKDIHVALFTTTDREGSMHARPMVAIRPEEGEFDGVLWFFTRADSRKTHEIEKDAHVLLSYANPKDQQYVSLSGTAEVIHDRAAIEKLWSEPLRTWFPKGSDDPEIALIRVATHGAEYWDSPSSVIVYAYGYAKALLTGTSPNIGEHEQVNF